MLARLIEVAKEIDETIKQETGFPPPSPPVFDTYDGLTRTLRDAANAIDTLVTADLQSQQQG